MTRWSFFVILPLLASAVPACRRGADASPGIPPAAREWSTYGADPAGTRYSPLTYITRENVTRLDVAWTVRTGDWSHKKDGTTGPAESCARCHQEEYKFEATPIIADARLYLSTPFNRIVALDPATGALLWRHDPGIDAQLERNEGLVSRGVAYWEDGTRPSARCGKRILFGTIDARLLALDAVTGAPCPDFGDSGTVRLDHEVGRVQVGQYGVTSPPAVVGDVVVVGSSMGDNRRVDMERGVVRGFDVRSGRRLWAWDPIPRAPTDPGFGEWTPEAAAKTGAANAWAPLSADPARGLVFVPTGSAAPDFYGGERPGSNVFANSVVALDATTGRMAWHFQTVHHDLWDYDVAAQPSLVTVRWGGRERPAVVAATKSGFLFFLDPDNGAPLFPVEERSVPPSTVPGERASPTQPWPTLPPPLHPMGMTEADIWGATPRDLEACRQLFASMGSSGFFAPPSLDGTVMYPGYGGGFNWGGVAFDRERRLLIVNQLRLPAWVRLTPRTDPERGNQVGTPYTMTRAIMVAPSGMPCVKPPWGVLMAIDLATMERKWEVPLGYMPGTENQPGAETWGSPTIGGPMVTASGLVFIAATADQHLRAFDVETGRELWRGRLPAGAMATPMTYAVDGVQYVVIAAGGHSSLGAPLGDHVVAFALR
ncbi:MAG TPA: pyrroloquinoline quinone-dependent dehydrogenase [Gemmatimonadales bacterium]|nr:pyrroloquinoline quinone-dependent dehydrogenase [Gemmatimonadales bacterium]